jgi:hypothetical protein
MIPEAVSLFSRNCSKNSQYRWSFDNGAELLRSWLSGQAPETDVSLAEKKATLFLGAAG